MQEDMDGHRQFQLFSRPLLKFCWDFQTCFFILSSPLGESPLPTLKSKRSVLQKWNKSNGERVMSMWLELSHCSDGGERCCPFLGICCVHFADSGGLNLPVCQVPTLPCSGSLLNRTWGLNEVEELMGQDKSGKITHQLPSQKNQIWPQNDSVNSLLVNSRMRSWEIKNNFFFKSSSRPTFPRLSFTPDSFLSNTGTAPDLFSQKLSHSWIPP